MEYHGLVSNNTDKYQEDHVSWWDCVDVISSSGYYPIDQWEQKDGSSYPVSSFYNSTPFVSITCLYQNAESFMRNEFYIMLNN